MLYLLEITQDQWHTIVWLSQRGYDAGIFEAMQCTDNPEVFAIEEHDAWDCFDQFTADPHAWLTCCGDSSLADTLNNFISNIV